MVSIYMRFKDSQLTDFVFYWHLDHLFIRCFFEDPGDTIALTCRQANMLKR